MIENIQSYYISREQKSLAGITTAIPGVGDELNCGNDCDEDGPIVDINAFDPLSTTANNEIRAAINHIDNTIDGVYHVHIPLDLDTIPNGLDQKQLKIAITRANCTEDQHIEMNTTHNYKPWPDDISTRVFWVDRLCSSLDQCNNHHIEITDYPSISEMIIARHLNKKQAATFTLIASLLLR